MMETPPDQGLIETLQTAIGGAATALLAAFMGRAMHHANEVRAKRRPVFSRELIWEVPLAFGMALIGDSLGQYCNLSRDQTVGLIAVLSYLGPRGAGAALERWAASRK